MKTTYLPGAPSHGFVFHKLETAHDLPPADRSFLDIALLDMNHEWPNIGHDSLARVVAEAAFKLEDPLRKAGLTIRVLSFDVRKKGLLPESPNGRFSLYIGTGGPGHLDPRLNDGSEKSSQGIIEDPSWEVPFFHLLDSIAGNQSSSLIAVCHTFGVLCRWAGIAEPRLRGEDKGGKSSGIVDNILTDEAVEHPWFRRFSAELTDGRHLRIIDNRLFDLIPTRFPAGVIPLSYEADGKGGPAGQALTMVEFARDSEGVMPRILAVNHHPEVIDNDHFLTILKEMFRRGEVTTEWFEERYRTLSEQCHGDEERRVRMTSMYTLVLPIEFQLRRLLRARCEDLGFMDLVSEADVIAEPVSAAL